MAKLVEFSTLSCPVSQDAHRLRADRKAQGIQQPTALSEEGKASHRASVAEYYQRYVLSIVHSHAVWLL